MKECINTIAKVSTPDFAIFFATFINPFSSKLLMISPLKLILSSISNLKCLGTIGEGISKSNENKSYRHSLPISNTSLKPCVVNKAVLTPFLSISAFATSVVP